MRAGRVKTVRLERLGSFGYREVCYNVWIHVRLAFNILCARYERGEGKKNFVDCELKVENISIYFLASRDSQTLL